MLDIVKSLEGQLVTILKNKQLTAHFQPIVNLQHRSIYGYEGLIRGPSDSPLGSPQRLFEVATRCDRLVELDLLCRKIVIGQFARLNIPCHLFINIDPLTIISNKFRAGETIKFAQKNGIDTKKIIIEITETRPIDNVAIMKKAVDHYRSMGFRVALDDLGAGYASLKLWSQIKPDIVKIDRHFIRNVNNDLVKQEFIRTILNTSTSLGCTVISEGVETEQEYSTLRKLGITIAQGYYFSRPEPVPPLKIPATRFRKEQNRKDEPHSPSVKVIIRPTVSVQASETVLTVGKIFTTTTGLETIAVLHDTEVMGMVVKKEFMNIYAILYGKELYGKDPIVKHMNRNIMIVDQNMPIEQASYRLTTSIDLYTEEFILTDRGRLAGKGMMIDLLHYITEIKIRQARHANPLTRLPGNVPIQQKMLKCLEDKTDFTICYFDLDHFKPFNDVFGFGKGDEVILFVAKLLRKHIKQKNNFIGHIGGDDFITVFREDHNWQKTVKKIIDEFDKRIDGFYDGSLDDNQTITATDRQGNKCSYERMGLSVGAVVIDKPGKCAFDLSSEAAKAKHHAKAVPGSNLYIHKPLL
jgi:diguanylate cyclase (GGDEF)-like protein